MGEVVVEVVEVAEVVVEEGNININISINWLRPSWGYSFNVMDFILICLIQRNCILNNRLCNIVPFILAYLQARGL